MLNVTADELVQVAAEVWPDRLEMPAQIWVDHFHGDHTFLRATYPEGFTSKALDRLHAFKATVIGLYGPKASVTIVIYDDEIHVEEAVARSTAINLVP
jgi:hypothetical protein